MPLEGCYQEDRGDGVIVVLPPSYDPARLAHPLPDHLRGSLRRHNGLAAEHARMRLRIALHSGPLESDSEGIVGTSVNHVNRLLDAPSFKEALAAVPADLGVLASDEFYREVIREGRGAIDPTEFRPIEVRLKETETTAWLSVRTARPPEATGDGANTPARVGPLPASGPPAPGLDARQAPDQADVTALPALFEIVERLMDIPLLTTAEGRQQIVDALRKEIAIRVPRRTQPHLDVHSIVRTCSEFPGGLQEFLALVHAYAGESLQVQALDDTVARLTGRAS
ncbi:effector-associated domain 2-containing protein [Spirillospora sp. CA-108201]